MTSFQILTAVREMCADMVALPIEAIVFKKGDIVISRSGNKYKVFPVRGSKDLFRLQSMSNLQICHGQWTARQMIITGVKKI